MNPARVLERAAHHYQRGELEQALAETNRLLAKRPKLGDALHLRGLILDRLGKHDEAIATLEKAARLLPNKVDLLIHLGATQTENGRAEAAIPPLRKATRLAPTRPDAWYHLGTALLQMNAHDDAREALDQAHRLRPDHVPTLNNLALSRLHSEPNDAERLLRQATTLAPDHPDGWLNLGELLFAAQRWEEAEPILERAIALDPHKARTFQLLGLIHDHQDRKDKACDCFQRAYDLDPDNKDIVFQLARALIQSGRPGEADRLLERLPSEEAHFHGLKALWHQAQKQWQAAENCYRKALSQAPDNPDHWNGLGLVLYQQTRFTEAGEAFERALQLAPDHALSHSNYSLLLLLQGRSQEGFHHYRYRKSREKNNAPFADIPLAENLSGQHILLIGDQGIGDELFFLRYLPELEKRNPGQITLLASQKLVPLLQHSHSRYQALIKENSPRPPADLTYSMGDLAFLLDNPPLPSPLPLRPKTDYLKLISKQLRHLGPPPYLGLTWRAGPRNPNDLAVLDKHIPLQALADAVSAWPGTYLALQRRPEQGELERLSELLGRPVFDLTTLNEDLEVMLAALELIDDYVAVSNTNVHLRASLGRPSRVLIPLPSEWRWGLAERSPWFPDHPLYREHPHQGWRPALDRLKTDLEASYP